jgi:hypothetical protein
MKSDWICMKDDLLLKEKILNNDTYLLKMNKNLPNKLQWI